MRVVRLVAPLLAALAFGCSTAEKPKPTPLESFTPSITVTEAWRHNLGDITFPLVASVNDDRVTLADGAGNVVALQASSGRELWRASVGSPISAGVGSDGRFAAVVTRDNELVTLDVGVEKWRTRLPSSVSTPPLVAGERVFAMGVDRAVHAFDVLDGRKLWLLQRPGDALTLSSTGVVVPFKNTLLVGQGPRLAGVDPLRGGVRWEVALASPRGTNEVERLADLIGPVVRAGDVVCARAFQSAVGCADAERGTLLWTKNVGGTQAIGGDAELVLGADATDRITAWRTPSGEVAWTSERFLYRGLSAPARVGRSIAFGDVEGHVHFLDRAGGETLARVATDGSPVIGRPALAAGHLVVVTRKGAVLGLRAD
jgi:outer membrane protein assembly factor BamB